MPGVKKFVLLGCLLFICSFSSVKAQTDTTKTITTEKIQLATEPDLKLEQDKKRQKKTEKIVFVSCLFIVLTTILLYNVRSK